jgi:hypothetical protein
LRPGASNCTVLPLTTSGLRLLAIKIGLPVRRKRNEARGFLRAMSASRSSATRLIDKFLGGFLSPQVIRAFAGVLPKPD